MLLNLRNLTLDLPTGARLVDGVSLSIASGETVALVGESGCGKTLTALSIMRLTPPGIAVRGQIEFESRDLLALPPAALRQVRGARAAMIFQEPMTSLNPVVSVGAQIAEPLRVHRGLRPAAAWVRAVDLLRRVGIPDAGRRARGFPHEMSGGMRQRVMIAMALSCEPALLIADEPTTALDVTVQAQILALLRDLQAQFGMAVLLITHDLGVVAQVADRVYVMYSGRIVEHATTQRLFATPAHPYTRALLESTPRAAPAQPDSESQAPTPRAESAQRAAPARTESTPSGEVVPGHSTDAGSPHRLVVIPGEPPRPENRPSGCAFHPRCATAAGDPACAETTPALEAVAPEHACACWKMQARAPAGH